MIGLRPATEEDRLHLAKCWENDPWHNQGDASLEDWLARDITTFYDEDGPAIHMCFIEEGKTLRMSAQFNTEERLRNARNIPAVLEIIKACALTAHHQKLVMWSRSPKLVSFMKRLEFQEDKGELVLALGN